MAVQCPTSKGRSITTSTINIRTIARITMALMDCLSEPKIIGIGPINRTPALLPPPGALDGRAASMIMAITARTNPTKMSRNPIPVKDERSNEYRQNYMRIVRKLKLFQFFQKRSTSIAVIVYKRGEATSEFSLRRSEISWTSDPKSIVQAENLP